MSNYTLAYDEGVQGFPSFYSYQPEWMIGMNNYFYTFKGGNLYRHNVNESRNTFYNTTHNSTIQSVFNDQPLENKLFKTINLEGDNAWALTSISTDMDNTGYIDVSWFEEKEGSFFAYIRNNSSTPPNASKLRSLNGIGRSEEVNGGTQIKFNLNVNLDTIMSVGDLLYFSNPPGFSQSFYAGKISSINKDVLNGVNNIVITTDSSSIPITDQTSFFFYVKNSVAESQGVLGHYGVFNLQSGTTQKINLFAVESEVLKSYP